MKQLRHILVLTALAAVLTGAAQITYQQAQERADRFFGYREWASASALYNYMLEREPRVADTYGRAIVTNSMLNDSIRSMQLLQEAMAYNIPLDSVLGKVRQYSFIVGRGDLYERFMLQAAHEYQWLARPLDHQLLKYYMFRNNGTKMIEYANILLKGVPGDVRFMSILADGYMLTGETDRAVELWQQILTKDPDNYLALLQLASYYRMSDDKELSRQYYLRAQRISPTPYVASALDE